MSLKLSQKGWIVIPAAMRKKYGLKPGSNLLLVDYGGVLSLVPAFKDAVKEGAGLLKGCDSLTQAVVDEHRSEVEHGK
jgi:AbrB family looped-hinge helix DNA binding protein